jgi:Family of unknown function (DUF6084)
MEQHYPNCGWIYLKRDVFDRLYEHRRSQGMGTWDQAVEALLENQSPAETAKGGIASSDLQSAVPACAPEQFGNVRYEEEAPA